jgi:hypothetical protein
VVPRRQRRSQGARLRGAAHLDRETDIVYETDDPKNELLAMLSKRFAPVLDQTNAVSFMKQLGLAK